MSTVSHDAPRSWGWLSIPGVVESLAISAMWLAVAVASVWGGDFVSSTPGGSTTTIPAGACVALFAAIGTWFVAKYGLGRER